MSIRASLERLSVRRMYGQGFDGLRVTNLSPGLNIIYGPNAAGKTTIARAIRILLWPDYDEGGSVALDAQLKLGDDRWSIDIELGRRSYNRNGLEADWPSFLNNLRPESYHLSLHDLLVADNVGFAEAIRREASGGYDVRKAAETLSFRHIHPRSGESTKTLSQRRQELSALQDKQEQLWQQKQTLKGLEEELRSTGSANERADLLEKAIAYHEARKAWESTSARADAFPEIVERLTGTELERLEQLKQEAGRLDADLAAAREKIEGAQAAIEDNHLPEEGLEEGMLARIREMIRQLQQAEERVARHSEDLEGADAEEKDTWDRIQGAVDPHVAQAFTFEDLQALSSFVQRVETARSKDLAFDTLGQLLHVEAPDGLEHQQEVLRDAQRHLLRWLQAGPAETGLPSGPRYLLLATAVAVAAASIALGLLIDSIWFVLLAVTVAIGGALVWAGRTRGGEMLKNQRQKHRTEFERLSVESRPDRWVTKAVEKCLDVLLRQRADLEVKIERARRWAANESGRDELKRELVAIDARRQQLMQKIGLEISPDISLLYVIEHLIRWQKAQGKRKGLKQELEQTQEHVKGLLAALNELLERYDLEPLTGAAEALQRCEVLAEAQEELRSALTMLDQGHTDFKETQNDLNTNQSRSEKLFSDLGLEPEAEDELQELLAQRDASQKARDEVMGARAVMQETENILRRAEGFEENLLKARPEVLEHERADFIEKAEQADELRERITEIRTNVKNAEESGDVTIAGARYRKAVEDLAQEREKDYQRMAGHVLAEYLFRETREQDLPKVFHHARDLFLRVTNGRYKLDLNELGFRAFDTVLDRSLALDELSSGTRVQLLLCVRVAFVELQETEYRLPLTFDETLANSDDTRAQAIIEAVCRLAQDRQVFYFTAQRDEVAKWMQLADGVEHALLSLGDAPAPEEIDLVALPSLPKEIAPSPQDHSHDEYGAKLQVPRWSAYHAIGSLHLWYLIEDVQTLYRLLTEGLTRWGPTRELLRSPLRRRLNLDEQCVQRLSVLGDAVTAWQKAWKIGRGKPVDREVLENSGAISDTFIERVAELCERHGGDGEALFEALFRGTVIRFQAKNAEKLRLYLEQHGYISEEEILPPEEIRRRVFVEIAADLAKNDMDHHDVDRLLERIRSGSSSAS